MPFTVLQCVNKDIIIIIIIIINYHIFFNQNKRVLTPPYSI